MDVEKALDGKHHVSKPLPKIASKYWDVFEKWAEDEHSGNWGAAFTDLVKQTLVEPEWLSLAMDHENRIIALEEKKDEVSPFKDEPELDLGTTCDGVKVNEYE